MSAEVAVYVQSKYAKPAYTVESYNVRAWPAGGPPHRGRESRSPPPRVGG